MQGSGGRDQVLKDRSAAKLQAPAYEYAKRTLHSVHAMKDADVEAPGELQTSLTPETHLEGPGT